MKNKSFILKGNIIFSKKLDELLVKENAYLICEKGICKGVFEIIPEKYVNMPVVDCKEKLIIPGLYDLHLHAPQYVFRGLGMDLELLEWLNTNTFPEEAKYKDVEYADKAYSIFAHDLKNSFTARACIFATCHTDSSLLLMEKLEKTGLICKVGRVNMDRNSPDYLIEESAEKSAFETKRFIELALERFTRTTPIITPRFVPACSDELMEKLMGIINEYEIDIQSHLSENSEEIKWVKELCPWTDSYAKVYDRFGMLGSDKYKSIMAHCVYCTDEELKLLSKKGTYVAHSPQSNTNLSSGIAPVRKMLEFGVNVALSSDVAGGHTIDMLHTCMEAVQVSKLYARSVDFKYQALSFAEAFYLATVVGGSFFGKVGAFCDGYEFDALVIDDSSIRSTLDLSCEKRLERLAYLGNSDMITSKYVAGSKI